MVLLCRGKLSLPLSYETNVLYTLFILFLYLLLKFVCRMAHARLGQWLSLLVCLLILLKAESHPVGITLVENAVAKGAGEKYLGN